MTSMIIELRPATPADDDFCYRLHQAALGEHVTAIWGWDEKAQREYHRRAFDPDSWMIITADGADVGMIDIDYRAEEIYLGRIEILPDHQGRGIGTRLIEPLLAEADRRGQDLILDVLAVNRRAIAFYRRLGLHEVSRHGPNDIKIRMRYVAGSGTR